MTVLIQIHYISNNIKVLQQGDFQLRDKKPEEVAFEWFKQIQREMPYGAELEEVIVDGENITNLVRKLEKAPLN